MALRALSLRNLEGLSWERLGHRAGHSGAVPGVGPATQSVCGSDVVKTTDCPPGRGVGAGYAPAVSTQVSCFYTDGLRTDLPGETLVRWP